MRSFLALALLAGLGACAKPGGPPNAAAGKAYFSQVGCASCHRVGSEGSATGPDLTLVGFRHAPEWLELFIKDPKGWKAGTLMPDTRLSPDARAAIVAYLAGLKGQDWPKGGRPWDAAAGKHEKGRLIFVRAGCANCHGGGGLGGQPNNNVPGGAIPKLVDAAERFSRKELADKIRRGVVPVKKDPAGPAPLIRMPAWGEVLDDAELEAVAEYVLSLKSGAKPEF